METLIYFFIFIFGLAVGSFLNCLIFRLENNKSFLKGRSFCPSCNHVLKWKDLIPVFSFIFSKGKCQYCQKPISFQYPLVELFTGVIFLLIFFQFPILNQFSVFNFLNLIFYWIISSFLIVVFIYDLKHYIIPDKVIYSAIFISLIWYFVSGIIFNFYGKDEILNIIYSSIGAAGFFLLIVLISRGQWMGIGDIKLAFLMGLFLGFPNIFLSLFLSFLIGAIIGTGLIIFGGKRLKSEIPFGPFLVIGTFIALFWGEKIINFYLNLINV